MTRLQLIFALVASEAALAGVFNLGFILGRFFERRDPGTKHAK